MKKGIWVTIALLLVASMALTACGAPAATSAPPAATEAMPATSAPAATEAMPATAAPTGNYLDRAMAGEFKGTTVTATGPFVAQDETKFLATIAPFEEQTGITIQYNGDKNFEADIKAEIEGGAPPDIVDFPQPGLLATFAANGKLVNLDQNLDVAAIKANYDPYWIEQSMFPGADGTSAMYGIWERNNVKGFVYYPKKAWDAAGYQPPTTFAELQTLMDQMVSDGTPPWCIGIESGSATGWVATDWMENIMLRTAPPSAYDDWISHKLLFTSPEVTNAADIMQKIWQTPGYVYGGAAYVVKTSFGDSTAPMFDPAGPKCLMNMNGNFIQSFFPADAKPGVDYGAFYFPPIDPQYGSPVEVGGDIWGATSDRPEVMAVMQAFASAQHLKIWMEQGGAFAPQKDADPSWYGNPVDQAIGTALKNATTFRFDASDLMPQAVGQGSFWKEMTSWESGAEDMNTALKNIDASWPSP